MATKKTLEENDPIEMLNAFTKSMPDMKQFGEWGKTIMKGMDKATKQPKVVEKKIVKFGKASVTVSLCDNGAIAVEFGDQKIAKKFYDSNLQIK